MREGGTLKTHTVALGGHLCKRTYERNVYIAKPYKNKEF